MTEMGLANALIVAVLGFWAGYATFMWRRYLRISNEAIALVYSANEGWRRSNDALMESVQRLDMLIGLVNAYNAIDQVTIIPTSFSGGERMN